MLLTKREFITALAAGAAATAFAPHSFAQSNPKHDEAAMHSSTLAKSKETAMPFTLPDLPYAYEALEPYTSANTLRFHHDKHHAAYVANLNKFVEGTDMAGMELEEVIKKSAADKTNPAIFNNAAQIWNHSFFWNCMAPKGGGKPKGTIAARIEKDLGGYDKFAADFKDAATKQFGSGWAWLVAEGGKLKIVKTGNADLPMVHGQTAILTLDVWEHAYYLDYQNRRPDFITAFLDHLVNWEFAEANLAKA